MGAILLRHTCPRSLIQSIVGSTGGPPRPLARPCPRYPADLPRVVRWCVALVRSVDAYTVPNGRASFSISRVLPGTVPFAFFFSLLLFSIATPTNQHRFSRLRIIFVRLIMCMHALCLSSLRSSRAATGFVKSQRR